MRKENRALKAQQRGRRIRLTDPHLGERSYGRTGEHFLRSAGVHVAQTPVRAPNCNAHAERFARSIKFECLHRVIPLGERHLRRAIREYDAHYNHERNHQGLDNELIVGVASPRGAGTVRRAQRLGVLLNFYHRAA